MSGDGHHVALDLRLPVLIQNQHERLASPLVLVGASSGTPLK